MLVSPESRCELRVFRTTCVLESVHLPVSYSLLVFSVCFGNNPLSNGYNTTVGLCEYDTFQWV